MSHILPKTTSSKQIQKNYRSLFDEVMKTKEPLVVFNRDKAEVVVIDIKTYDYLASTAEQYEQSLAKIAIENYQTEKANNKLQKLDSLADLM